MSDCNILSDILSDLAEARSVDTVSSNEEAVLDEASSGKHQIHPQQASKAFKTIRASIESMDGAKDIMAKFDDVERFITRKHLAARCGNSGGTRI